MSSPSSPDNTAGPFFGRYFLERRLGAGARGTVYLARDELRGRKVALKLLRADRLGPRAILNFQDEFRAAVDVRHPHIAAVYDFGYTDRGHIPYYTREYIEGEPLPPGPPGPADRTHPGRFFSPIFAVLDALEHLHRRGFLHLDIHAGNVIVTPDAERGSVLIDFGMGSLLQRSFSPATNREMPVYSVDVEGSSPADAATDLYLAGRLLLYRWTGDVQGSWESLRETVPWDPRLALELERLARRALHEDPKRRFQSARDFSDALARVVGGDTDVRKRSRLEPRERVVGREKEIGRVEAALETIDDAPPVAFWFDGPAGIGKSRLLEECRIRAQLRGLQVIDCAFPKGGAREPRLLVALRAGSRAAPAWLRPYGYPHGGSTFERARRAAEAYFASDEPPLVLLLDDIENADQESATIALALIAECSIRSNRARPGRGLVIVATSTDPPSCFEVLGGVMKTLRRDRLAPLSRSDAAALLESLVQPLELPSGIATKLTREAFRVPFRIRRIARELNRRFGRFGIIPPGTRLSFAEISTVSPAENAVSTEATGDSRQVLRLFGVLRRPMTSTEVARALAWRRPRVARALGELLRLEIVGELPEGRSRSFLLLRPDDASSLARSVPPREVRAIHQRLADYYEVETKRSGSAVDLEAYGRHLLALGRRREGREIALRAAQKQVQEGWLRKAAQLLLDLRKGESSRRWRIRFAEEISAIYELSGDHGEAIAIVESTLEEESTALRPAERIRFDRRLGVHCHHAGKVERALELFESVREAAVPARDAEELIYVESELAEVHTFRGRYDEAEAACRRGLALLGQLQRARWARAKSAERAKSAKRIKIDGGMSSPDSFLARMQVTLHASLGHLELRRTHFERAKEELNAAWKLARSVSTSTVQALILNNLGIAHSQSNEYRLAQRTLERARKILAASGQPRGTVQIACNLALLHARTGEAAAAKREIDTAEQLLESHPDARLEFFVLQTHGAASYFLGEMDRSLSDLECAIPKGVKLGDVHLVRYAEVYRAGALIASGRYGDAEKSLRSSLSRTVKGGPALLLRMVHAHRLLLARLLSRERIASESEVALSSVSQTHVSYIEAWIGFLILVSRSVEKLPEDAELVACEKAFEAAGHSCGSRLVLALRILCAGSAGDPSLLRGLTRKLGKFESDRHGILSVLEPIAFARAAIALGDSAGALRSLDEASGAIVGRPYLELDWYLEYLRARVAEKTHDRESARRFVHRALHARDLLAHSLPPSQRSRFLEHERFRGLLELEARLRRPVHVISTTPVQEGRGAYHGIIGRSEAMRRAFEMLEKLRDTEIPITIIGETGTGKDLVARAIHETSPRSGGPYLAVPCAAVPADLFDSEFFGHEAGAFTGAEEARPGLLEHLSGGTLYLDGIDSLPPHAQRKLGNVLDTGTIRRLGSLDPRQVDVRLIASAGRPLEAALAAGELTAEFVYRLRAVEVRLPPLRERREDIAPLVAHFVSLHAARPRGTLPEVPRETLDLFTSHPFPGNVRELEAIVRSALLISSDPSVLSPPLVARVLSMPGSTTTGSAFSDELLGNHSLDELQLELERAYVRKLFRETGGDVQQLSRRLGMKRVSFYARLRRIGLDIGALRRELGER